MTPFADDKRVGPDCIWERGERFTPIDDGETRPRHFFGDERSADVMFGDLIRAAGFRRRGRGLGDDESAPWLERDTDVPKHVIGLRHFMVGVQDHDGVEGARRQFRIVRIALEHHNIVEMRVAHALAQALERSIRDINRVNHSRGGHRRRQPDGEKPIAGADVGDGRTWTNRHRRENVRDPVPRFTFGLSRDRLRGAGGGRQQEQQQERSSLAITIHFALRSETFPRGAAASRRTPRRDVFAGDR
ncbi:MAG TPA: hypothetical protein VGY57_16730 [Vicinamibacterales bacterium]|nr:hypothetical protein [Vicinamibacterales bacterium]